MDFGFFHNVDARPGGWNRGARLVTDQIMVLNQGAVVEEGATASVLQNPQDDYTIRLLEAIPHPQAGH
jgi:peptide/nickel transport system ATP-binding protein